MSRRKPVKYPFAGHQHLKDILKRLDTIKGMSGHGRRRIVEDWIALMFWAFQRNEENYHEVIRRYDSCGRLPEVERLFAEALAELTLATWTEEKECLGRIWMEFSANERMGQFFSPPDVCKIIAKSTITNPPKSGVITVLEPCSGAGGMLVAVSQELTPEELHRTLFFAHDLDLACCMMTAINMVLFNVDSHIFHGDSLNPLDCRGAWFTVRGSGRASLHAHPLKEAKELKIMLHGKAAS